MADNKTSSSSSSPAILWSCIARGDVILVEAGEDAFNGGVSETAQQLLHRKPTPGWEFHRCRQHGRNVRGVKFHLYEYANGNNSNYGSDENDRHNNNYNSKVVSTPLRIWVFACVYENQLPTIQAQSFIEKMVTITELQREEHDDWKSGSTLAAQRSFGPILYQRMQEVQSMGRMAMCHERLDGIKEVMGRNIDLLLERGERLESLDKTATQLQKTAAVFKKKTRELRRAKMWQDAKHGIVIGTAVAAGVAVVTVPTLIAIL
jgi:hypothetical protein